MSPAASEAKKKEECFEMMVMVTIRLDDSAMNGTESTPSSLLSLCSQ